MDKEKIKQIIQDQTRHKNKETIPREIHKKIKESPFITIITGIRRSGKSTLLQQLREKKDGHYFNFEDERLIKFEVEDFQTLQEALIETQGKKNVYYFDEIQNIQKWERFIRRLHDEKNKIYITGSNATLLSKELGTHLTGRHTTLTLYPFSFKEFLNLKKHEPPKAYGTTEKAEIQRKFHEYLEKGGFPEYLVTEDSEYLKQAYEGIIYRDILARYKIPNEKALKETALILMSNIGKEMSYNSIKKAVGLGSTTTASKYAHHLENSFLIFQIPKYSPLIKTQTASNKKVYAIDTALIKKTGFRTSQDKGRMLENTAFIELKRRNKEIYYHKQKKECDFLIREGTKITEAIQVTWQLTPENRKREIEGLKEAMKTHNLKKGLIITESQEETIGNIKVIPAWKWLLETS